jgi:signal transduction histidine kinase/DNA-binding response OmpR family regulator
VTSSVTPDPDAPEQTRPHPRYPTIGVLAGWQFYWTATPLSYLGPLFDGLGAAARDLGSNLLLACGIGLTASPNDPFRPAWPQPAPDADFVPVGPWNTDGLIVINPLHSAARSRYVHELIAIGHPVLFVGSGEGRPEIIADNVQGVRQAIQHLADHGHQRIAFIAGSPDDLSGDSGERLQAYQAALAADERLTLDASLIAYGRHVFGGGYAAMREILATAVPFTAVLASNDESAFGAMQALKEAGLRIPEDVALIGFDDRLETLIQTPPLTSVHIPLYDLGYQSLQLLLQMIAGETETHVQKRIPTRLVLRRSCGCGQERERLPIAVSAEFGSEPATAQRRRRTVQAMVQTVQLEARHLTAEEIRAYCERLIAAFESEKQAEHWPAFHQTLADLSQRCHVLGEDVSIWQSAISLLRQEALAGLSDDARPVLSPSVAEMLDRALISLAQDNRRQVRQNAVAQRQTLDRVAHLTAQWLTVTDEAQVFEVLARHLPDMDIPRAMIAFFESEEDDPVAWSLPHIIPPSAAVPARFASRQFPPPGLFPSAQPINLALLPLVCQSGRTGYVAFEAVQLALYGSIVPQLAAALDRAQLYRDALEGRRLAEEADRLKSRFLSTVSHELRMPLNLIVGLSEILLKESDDEGAPLPEPARQDLERIYANAQHLGGLIGDVLDLASSDAGQLRLNTELVDLGQALGLVAGIGRQLAGDKGLAWRAIIPETGPWVQGDRTRLRQIALNLINNAIKFTARGEVSLIVETSAQSVTVAVRDSGIGIPPEEQSFIFDEFRRSQRSLTGGYGGLGLGLAICKRLVELQGGVLWLESTGVEGEGATFYFTLPTVTPPAPPTAQLAGLPLTEQSVLLLPGRSGSAEQLQTLLSRHGFDVRVAELAGARERLSQLLATPPAVIVVELSLAAEHGWEILKTLRESPTSSSVPVLFYTLSADRGAVLELDYLTKPIGLTELTRALDQQWLVTGEGAVEKTILVVDDDPNTVEMNARMVRSHSARHRILKAHNGREALALLQHERADLVLLDLVMPELDGFGVLEAMRASAATRDTPVIVLTGQTLTEADMQRLNQGVATVLSKGLFNADETLSHLQAALGRQRKLGSQAQRLARQAMAYLHAHYAEPITRDGLARYLGMSEDYLTLCFRKELGMTPIAYLNRVRVNEAKALLVDTHKSITEIALAVGFSDSGYFSRVFRQKVGLSPEAFRRA